MTDNELLLAISNILEPIRDDIRELKVEVLGLKDEIAEQKIRMTNLELEVADLKNEMSEFRDRVKGLENEMSGIKEELSGLKGEIKGLRIDFINLSDRLTRLEHYTKQIAQKQEMDVIPRLQNIEQCYLSKYERYKLGVEEHEVMKQDVSVLKLDVTEHSEKLQRIS